MSHEAAIRPETRVPDDETPVRCPYCDRPFPSERAQALHVGDVHDEECTAEERAAHEAADEAEVDELFFYHMKVIVAIGLLYGTFVLAYMVVFGN